MVGCVCALLVNYNSPIILPLHSGTRHCLEPGESDLYGDYYCELLIDAARMIEWSFHMRVVNSRLNLDGSSSL